MLPTCFKLRNDKEYAFQCVLNIKFGVVLGSHRYGRRVSATGSREVDNLSSTVDGKTSKRGSPGYGAHEVW